MWIISCLKAQKYLVSKKGILEIPRNAQLKIFRLDYKINGIKVPTFLNYLCKIFKEQTCAAYEEKKS